MTENRRGRFQGAAWVSRYLDAIAEWEREQVELGRLTKVPPAKISGAKTGHVSHENAWRLSRALRIAPPTTLLDGDQYALLEQLERFRRLVAKRFMRPPDRLADDRQRQETAEVLRDECAALLRRVRLEVDKLAAEVGEEEPPDDRPPKQPIPAGIAGE